MAKKLMFLLCLALMVGFAGSQAYGLTLNIRLTDGADDAEEHLDSGAMDITSSDLEFPYEDNGDPSAKDPQLNVLRFASFPLGKTALISSAYIELEQDETKGNDKPVNVIIEGQLVPDAPAIVDEAKNLSSRGPWTVANVKWTVPMQMTNNTKFQSPDIAAILNEILAQEGWARGNALLLAIRDDPENPSTGLRCVESVEGEQAAAVLLHLEYTVPEAAAPAPADGATNVADGVSLSWAAGVGAVEHDVFLGTDQAAVAAGDATTLQGRVAQASFTPGARLMWNTTYYWRVDEIDAAGNIAAGPVWSFTVADFLVVDLKGKTLNYDNGAAPNVSQLAWDQGRDWTVNGISDLVLQFQGKPATQGNVSFDAATGTYTIVGAGTDIWGTTDQFTFVFKALEGDGVIQARVTSNGTGSNKWAKGGVMIRADLTPGALNAFGAITGGDGDGGTFQWRKETNKSSDSSRTLKGIAPPYWVRVTRAGNTFTCEMSADGQTWEQEGEAPKAPVDVNMPSTVLIGLAVTSHQAGEERAFMFDNVSITGTTVPAGPLAVWDVINATQNDAQPIYAALEDAAGNVAAVNFGDPAATLMTQAWSWKIPLASFAGVDLTNVAKLYLGVGDLLNPAPGGNGAVTFKDIRVVKPVVLNPGDDVTAPGDNVVGVPNDGVSTANTNGWPANEAPPFAIDNDVNTKFLHFKGEVEPTGFRVEPLAGPTVVTGLSFTTANDAPERDPVLFEISGSNESIEGPYTLIASGMIMDFAQPVDRFTKNATPITFENTVAYRYYQVMFPAVRDAASANSMQIAEVELLQ